MNYIGRSNIRGKLRFWYYKKRGWVINDQYFWVGKPAHKVITKMLKNHKAYGGKIK